MSKKSEFQTTPFTIAHYILLFMVTIVCISTVTWLIMGRYNDAHKNNIVISYMMSKDPCVVRTRDAVSKMWAYNQELIPIKYKTMVDTYINDAVLTRVKGYCNDAVFTCRAGQLRRICDPCAVEVGQQRAMERHTLDLIHANCGDVFP